MLGLMGAAIAVIGWFRYHPDAESSDFFWGAMRQFLLWVPGVVALIAGVTTFARRGGPEIEIPWLISLGVVCSLLFLLGHAFLEVRYYLGKRERSRP